MGLISSLSSLESSEWRLFLWLQRGHRDEHAVRIGHDPLETELAARDEQHEHERADADCEARDADGGIETAPGKMAERSGEIAVKHRGSACPPGDQKKRSTFPHLPDKRTWRRPAPVRK